MMLFLAALIISSVEKEKIEMEYEGRQGFWMSSYLAGELVKSDNLLNATWYSLGMNVNNYEQLIRFYRKADMNMRWVAPLCVGFGLAFTIILFSFLFYIIMDFLKYPITFREI